MANTHTGNAAQSETLSANPVVVVRGIGQLGRSFLREVGAMFWFIAHTLDETIDRVRQGRIPFRAASFFQHTERAGVESVPLVGLVSFFLGLTMALLTGYQLARFGTERLVPGLVAIGFTRELGPLLTGIMLAARIGAAFTAELGTMKVSEEVEAIEAMGIGPLRFLVAPRMLALFFLMPCLSTISNIAAIFASSLVCRAYFNMAFVYFIDLVRDALLIRDIITGILKEPDVWLDYRRDRLLSRIDRERRRRRRRGRDHLERGHRHHRGDWRRYALQHDLHGFFPDMSAPPSYVAELRDVKMQFDEKKCSMECRSKSIRWIVS